ncbi:unnamed protein product [Arctia plantaginis]|uniref:Uncharacterized protein n=1 Tax=Arctia plantaginis TaxID=874455 RepID=A0A8S0Z959_ARCPL|nr:unnamed protein product [Arctia plantaginis]
MTPKLSALVLIFTPASVFAQFSGDSLRPDVTFNDYNDRFDLTSMIQDSNRMYQQDPQAPEDEESRRSLKSNEEQNGVLEFLTADKPRKSARRSDNDFAYHDRMDSNEGGTVMEYEQNLKHFMNDDNLKSFIRSRRMSEDRMKNYVQSEKLNAYIKYLHNGREEGRRRDGSGNEKDLLMHYGVPFVMHVDGYLKVPLN